MSRIVLDTSAILAQLWSEPGAEIVNRRMENSIVSAVNLAEVFTKLIERGLLEIAETQIALLQVESPIRIVPFDEVQAIICARLRTESRSLGLSLGDRACLALAIIEGATVLTADRVWADLGLSVKIELIR